MPRRVAVALGSLLIVGVAGVIAWNQFERIRCDAQATGDGPSRYGSNCGYQLVKAPNEFRFAVASGIQTQLLLSGGTEPAPNTIRIVRDGAVVIERSTRLLTAENIDVCRNQPPQDARWWSAEITDELGLAIRQGNTNTYRVEGLINGQWVPLQLHDAGCRWISS